MLFKTTYQLITESNEFQEFKKQNPEAELCAGFFVKDFFGNDNKRSLDFKIGEKIFTFNLRDDDSVKMQEDKLVEVKEVKFPELKTISKDIKTDLDEVIPAAQIKSLDEGISAKFNKVIAVLQKYNHNGKDTEIWNLTCMLEGLIILHILVDADTGDIIKFERKSMMDLIRKK